MIVLQAEPVAVLVADKVMAAAEVVLIRPPLLWVRAARGHRVGGTMRCQ
jgi:hypothetical protein